MVRVSDRYSEGRGFESQLDPVDSNDLPLCLNFRDGNTLCFMDAHVHVHACADIMIDLPFVCIHVQIFFATMQHLESYHNSVLFSAL